MKRYCFSLILNAVIIASATISCEKEDTAVGMTVSGTLEFSERYEGEITRVEVVILEPVNMGITVFNKVTLASGPYSNGSFSVELPAMVDDKFLVDTRFNVEGLPSNFRVSDRKVKIGVFSFSTTNLDNTSSESNTRFDYLSNQNSSIDNPMTGIGIGQLGIVYPLIYAKSDDKSVTEAMFLYADRKSSIIGSMTAYDELTEFTVEKTFAYSMRLIRGWNIVYVTQTIFMESPDKQVRREEISTNPVSGLKWYVHWDFY